MYLAEDKESAIREVQRLLKEVGDAYENDIMKNVRVNGIYDERTSAAVSEYQSNNEIAVTGRVNEETFYSVYDTYTTAKNRKSHSLTVGFPITHGVFHRDMILINNMLYHVSQYYFGNEPKNESAFFGENTGTAAYELRNIFLMPPSYEIDEDFYSRLLIEYYSIEKIKENL